MKRRVFFGALAWAVLITVVHVQLNVGWATLRHEIDVRRGAVREELIVGFLPVT